MSRTFEKEMAIIMEGAKPEIENAIRRMNWELFIAYMQSRDPYYRPTSELAKRKDIAPSWNAWIRKGWC